MAKKRLTQIDHAVANLEQQIAVLQAAIAQLRAQQAAVQPRVRKPTIVKSA